MDVRDPESINKRIRRFSGYIGQTCRYGLESHPVKKTGVIVGLEQQTSIGTGIPLFVFRMDNGDVWDADHCYTFHSFNDATA